MARIRHDFAGWARLRGTVNLTVGEEAVMSSFVMMTSSFRTSMSAARGRFLTSLLG